MHTGCEGFTCPPCPHQGSDGETPLLLCLAVSRTMLLSAGTDPWLRMLTGAREEASVFSCPAAPRMPPPPHTATPPASERERCRRSPTGWPWQSRWWGSLQLLLSPQFWSHTLGGSKPAEHGAAGGSAREGCRSLQQAAPQLVLWDPCSPTPGAYRTSASWNLCVLGPSNVKRTGSVPWPSLAPDKADRLISHG